MGLLIITIVNTIISISYFNAIIVDGYFFDIDWLNNVFIFFSYVFLSVVCVSIISIASVRSNFLIFIILFINFSITAPVWFASIYISLLQYGECINNYKEPYDALYFSYTTLTTLGYGDMSPIGWCRVVSSAEAIVGYVFLGVLAASMYGFIRIRSRMDL